VIVHFADLRGEGKNEDDYEKSHSEWTCREERNTAHLDVVKPLYFSETVIPSEMRAVRLGLTRTIDLHASPVEGKTEHEKKQAKNGRALQNARWELHGPDEIRAHLLLLLWFLLSRLGWWNRKSGMTTVC